MQFNDTQLDAVQQFLQAGNLLAYPTEAVWGIGCDPFNETAVKQILAIKQRPIEKGMIVITGDIAHIQPFLQPLPQQYPLLNRYSDVKIISFSLFSKFSIKIVRFV